MRKEKLINAIRETIIDLETGRREYRWSNPEHCNCGLLAKNLGASANDCLQVAIYSNAARNCSLTNMPAHKVIALLLEAGLTAQDITNLEYLNDDTILKEAGIVRNGTTDNLCQADIWFSQPRNVIKYFQAWLRILEREQPAPEPEYKLVVTCSEKVKALATEKVCLS